MIQFSVATTVAGPPEEVFAYATDPAKLATWQTNTVSAGTEDGGPMRLGARLKEVHRAPGGKQLASLVEVTEWHPPSAFALHVVEGFPLDARMEFHPAEAGTDVIFTAHGEPQGAMRLLQPVLRRTLRRQFQGYLDELSGAFPAS